MDRSYDITIEQVESITKDLLAIKNKVVVLYDQAGLTGPQRNVVASLQRSIDGVRGWELAAIRQAVGLDQDLAVFNKPLVLKRGKPG